MYCTQYIHNYKYMLTVRASPAPFDLRNFAGKTGKCTDVPPYVVVCDALADS